MRQIILLPNKDSYINRLGATFTVFVIITGVGAFLMVTIIGAIIGFPLFILGLFGIAASPVLALVKITRKGGKK